MLRRASYIVPATMASRAMRLSAPTRAAARTSNVSRRALRAQSAVSWQTPRAMAFSSSSSSSSSPEPPTIFDGVDGLMQYYTRCSTRTDAFERYERERVFSPANARFQNFFLYTKLQLPPQTQLDAIEFLNGAQFACDLAMHTMYSREFINYATGAITESKAAEHLARGLSRECMDAFLFAMRESSASGNSFDLTQLDIHGVYLVGVDWERLTLADLKAERAVASQQIRDDSDADVAATSVVDGDGAIAPRDYETMVQRMRLDVLLETKEHLDVQTADGQDQTIARDSSAVWRFESLVTTPEDVDWQIVSVI